MELFSCSLYFKLQAGTSVTPFLSFVLCQLKIQFHSGLKLMFYFPKKKCETPTKKEIKGRVQLTFYSFAFVDASNRQCDLMVAIFTVFGHLE